MEENHAYVIGVGVTSFISPHALPSQDYPELVADAVSSALEDCGVKFQDITAAYVGYVYGDSTSGQRSLYNLGMTGIPIFNVNNNCASGATAVMLAKQHVDAVGGCVLAVGFEKMEPGRLSAKFLDRANPLDRHFQTLIENDSWDHKVPPTCQLFGFAAREHMRLFGSTPEHFAKVAEKNHRHAKNNQKAQRKNLYTLDEVLGSSVVCPPLTKLQCCPTSNGAAAVILCGKSFVLQHGLQRQAVRILGIEMATDFLSTFSLDGRSLVGFDMTQVAADKLYAKTGVNPLEVQVAELHDCFSSNEVLAYEALRLCPVGGAAKFIDDGQNTYGGRIVVNPSGGLIGKGHPLGATGVAQCVELCLQLRGEAGARQVEGANIALQHNLGLGGAVVVALYKKDFLVAPVIANSTVSCDSEEDLPTDRPSFGWGNSRMIIGDKDAERKSLVHEREIRNNEGRIGLEGMQSRCGKGLLKGTRFIEFHSKL